MSLQVPENVSNRPKRSNSFMRRAMDSTIRFAFFNASQTNSFLPFLFFVKKKKILFSSAFCENLLVTTRNQMITMKTMNF